MWCMSAFRLSLLLLAGSLAWSQPAQVLPQPDCVIFFHFTATGQTSPTAPNAGYDNRSQGCITWALSANSVTFTAATVALQSAPNTAGGVAGTWVTFANATAITNTNPVTVAASPAQGFFTLLGYNPWVRVLLTVSSGPASGVVNGAAFGWRAPVTTSTGSGGGGSSNVTIVSPIGQTTMSASVAVAIASDQSTLPVSMASSSTVLSGQQAVTGSAVALATHAVKTFCVTANIGNTINVYVGPSGISTSTGKELPPGAGTCLNVTNSNLVFVIASTTGASVSWIATD
jgi:hypothetical protein